MPPFGSHDDAVDELWADVIEYDAWAAGLISRVVGGARPAQELRADPELRARIAEREAGSDPGIAADARALAQYLDELERLIALARLIAP
jgi:hypothetical protein